MQEEIIKGSSLWADAWTRLKKNKMATGSLFFLLAVFFCCFIIPFIGELTAPEDEAKRAAEHWFKAPNVQNLHNIHGEITAQNWLGTDQSGRDLFARMLYGGQSSLLVGIVATFISVVIGVIYGSIAGYAGGRTDSLMMRIVDVLYSLPFLVLVILFSILVSSHMETLRTYLIEDLKWDKDTVKRYASLIPLFVAISFIGWLTMARIVRAQVLGVKKLEFVEAAVSLGHSHGRILFKHILPNIMGPVIVYTTLTVPGFILVEAGLSFLGLGIEPPHSSWGILLKQGANYMETDVRLLIVPSLVFSLTLLALNFLGDGLRDALDPKASKD